MKVRALTALAGSILITARLRKSTSD